MFKVLKDAFKDWSEDNASRLSAAMAYNTLFSIAPLLVVVIAIVGLIWGQKAVQGQLVTQIQGLIGASAAGTIQSMIAKAWQPSANIIATILGIVVLLLGASGVFSTLQGSLNTIWEVKPAPGQGIKGILKNRALPFLMILGIGFILLVSLVISAALSALSAFFTRLLPGPGFALLWQLVNLVISFGIITLLFALIYKVLPDAEIDWEDVWIGAAFTALLFVIGKYLIGLYLGRSSVTSVYGAAGSLVVILLWIYYSSMILFFGAEFTQALAHHRGKAIQPKPGAVYLTPEDMAHQGITRPMRNTQAQPQTSQPGRPAARQPAQGVHHPAGAAVPVTGSHEQSITLPEHRRYPQRVETDLPPMPPGVRAFTWLAGALLATVGAGAALFASSRRSGKDVKVTREEIEQKYAEESSRREADLMDDLSGVLNDAAKRAEETGTTLRTRGKLLARGADERKKHPRRFWIL